MGLPFCREEYPLLRFVPLRRAHWYEHAAWAYRCPAPHCRQIIALVRPLREVVDKEAVLAVG